MKRSRMLAAALAALSACASPATSEVDSQLAISAVYAFSAQDGAHSRANLVLGPDGKLWGTGWQMGPSSGLIGTQSCSSNAAWSTEEQARRCPGSVFRVNHDGTEFEVVHAFSQLDGAMRNQDGYQPVASLVHGGGGWMYGTTSKGGNPAIAPTPYGFGTVFRIHAFTLAFETVHSFCSFDGCRDGAFPYGGLVSDGRGNLFGVTKAAWYAGGLYKIDRDGALSVLHVFDAPSYPPGQRPINVEGGNAYGAPALGLDGRLYGWDLEYGPNGHGTVWSVDPMTAQVQVHHAFTPYTLNNNEDNAPLQSMIRASDGALYGTSEFGGSNGTGIVFRVAEDGTYTQLAEFSAAPLEADPRHSNDTGALPLGTLYEHWDGRLYGTTFYGGSEGHGTIYRIGKDGSGLEVIYSFLPGAFAPLGNRPYSGLTLGEGGALYGTTFAGGAAGKGVIYKIQDPL